MDDVVFVEISGGSRNKYEWDAELGAIVRPIGVFHMTDEKGPDEKVICVPLNDPSWGRLSDIHDLPAGLRDEIEHFFQVYKDLDHEGKVTTRGFGNRSEAEDAIAEARVRARG